MDDTVRVATCFPFLSAASRGGRRLDDDSLTKLRRSHIGFIFQFFNLLPMLTVGDRQPLRHGQHADPVVFERTRELGMLRAVGMTRRQVRRMVRQESVITALIGAAVGLPLGMFLAALVSNALADEGIGFQVPWGQLVAFTIVAVIAGVLAAIVPARRAAKLNVLRALQYE